MRLLLWLGCAGALLPAQGPVHPSLLTPPPAAAAADVGRTVVQQAGKGVVRVYVEVTGARTPFAIERPGTGALIDASGLVVTWHALVAEAIGASDKRIVVERDGKAQPAELVATDEPTGLCLLRLPLQEGGVGGSLGFAREAPRPGTPAFVLARPGQGEFFAFAGVLAEAGCDVRVGTRTLPRADLVLCDARMDARADGGVLVDSQGRFAGLCSSANVAREVSEPTLQELQTTSYGCAVAGHAIRRAFAAHLRAVADLGMPQPPPQAQLAAMAAPGIVGVWAGDDAPPMPREPEGKARRPGVGSGVVLSADGLVVTNAHVLRGRDAAKVRLHDGRVLPAKLLRADAPTNLALLRCELPAELELQPLRLGRSAAARPGETVLAFGRPDGVLTVRQGVLSAHRRGGRVQADADLGNQNAGGALVDLAGAVLGIVDGGALDPIEVAFAMRGSEAKTESNLSTAIGSDALRGIFRAELGELPAAGGERPAASAVQAVVARSGPAMLNVYVSRTSAQKDLEQNPFADVATAEIRGESLGSGVIITPGGLAITNWHVVGDAVGHDGAAKPDHVVHVRHFDGRQRACRVLSISREDDLALLQLEVAPGETLPAVELGHSAALQVGSGAVAIGNPHGLANTVTAGVVCGVDQGIKVRGRWAKLENLIETDAAINGGNSGGALLDLDGRLIGINSAGSSGLGSRGYAIPVDHVRRQVLGLLLTAEKLRSPNLGLRVIDADGAVGVLSVDAEGPAGRAGVQAGDRLLALDGTELSWSPAFALALLRAEPGRDLDLRLRRGDEERTVRVAPLPASVWAVIRHAGLQLEEIPFAAEPDLLRTAARALHRRFTGRADAEPAGVPESVLRVTAVWAGRQPEGTDVRPGDLLLACELAGEGGGRSALRRFATAREVQDLFQDQQLGSYEGTRFRCWLHRDSAIVVVDLLAKRLFW